MGIWASYPRQKDVLGEENKCPFGCGWCSTCMYSTWNYLNAYDGELDRCTNPDADGRRKNED